MKGNTIVDVIIFSVFVLVIVVAIWAQTSAPCESFRYSSPQDIPGRCFDNIKGMK